MVVAVVFLSILLVTTCNKKNKVIDNYSTILKIHNYTIKYSKDVNGNTHAEKQVAEADIKSLHDVYGNTIDSLTKLLKIKDKQLQSYTGISTKDTGTVKLRVDTIYTDSISQYNFNYKDKWLTINGYLNQDSHLDYTINDSLGITVYNKKQGLFKSPVTIINVYSLNPREKINGITNFQILTKTPSRFGLGLYAGYGWNGTQLTPSAGISLTYTLIRF